MSAFGSLDEGLRWIEELTNFEKRPPAEVREYRLDRMAILLSLFDNPHRAVPAVHIAGSKGKGSCAWMISGILSGLGIRCGTYTSPHLLHYRERFMVDGEPVDDALLLKAVNEIYRKIKTAELPVHGDPTTFEVLTLMAFLVFTWCGCGLNVIETGLGGRLDATNLILPAVSVITSIEMEHANILGDTLSKIASEKAGIIKEGVPAVTSSQHPEALGVLEDTAVRRHSPFTRITEHYQGEDGRSFRLNYGGREYRFLQPSGLPGEVQKENAAVSVYTSLLVLERVFHRGDISALVPAVERCLGEIRIPGRFDRYSSGTVPVVIDGAHTVYSLKNFTTVVQEMYPAGSRSCVFGMVEGKDIGGSIRYILDTFNTVCITTPGTFKKSDIAEIYNRFCESAGDSHTIILEKEPETAFDRLLVTNPGVLCIAGSFYLAGIIKKLCNERGYQHA